MVDVQTRFLFFTGKGGVGKTSIASATALQLARAGQRVLIVSTDPASNLDTVLGTPLGSDPTPIAGVDGLFGLNIDPEAAAQAYRDRVIGPFRGTAPAEEIAALEEQLSGACTVEIAAFDEFTRLMTGAADAAAFAHVVFDTAPTGHTLRLLQLPAAWTSFIGSGAPGASCLGPLSGLEQQQAQYAEALAALGDPGRTTLILVTRPERSALAEAERTRVELAKQGVANQRLVVNGVFRASVPDDEVARKLEALGEDALAGMGPGLAALPRHDVPLKPYNVVGLEALARLFEPSVAAPPTGEGEPSDDIAHLPRLRALADEVQAAGHGLVMFMGKGGVGKTTMAAAVAVELAGRGVPVHLTTTDPAAHIEGALKGQVDNLRVSRIDPRAETEAYQRKMLARSRDKLDAQELALLEEDLRSPCTEEIAVFHAFSRIVLSAHREIVIMDTAPTGHTLLLLDTTGAYHREMVRQADPGATGRVATPLMRLQDPARTKVVLVALAETTPVEEAARLQDDLRRAGIEPYAWVINRSLAATDTRDPLLRARAKEEVAQLHLVQRGQARRLFVVPWSPDEPVGASALRRLMGPET